MKILVLSCDKNTDLFPLFHHCIEKYWPNHPEVIYSTETVENPFYKTICKNYPLEQWTKRVRECVEEIDDKHILIMCDDLFIRQEVTHDIEHLCNYLHDDIASINLEKSFDSKDIPVNSFLMMRTPEGKYKNSCLCSLWNKDRLLDVLAIDASPWEMEQLNDGHDFVYLILKDYFIEWEDPTTHWRWGLVRKGQWRREAKTFFDAEGIEVDYSIRGFIK